jgi:MFS family permease
MSTFPIAAPAPRRATRELSRNVAFWAIAGAFLTLAAFSTAPSALYGLYEVKLGVTSLTITFVYAIYVVGVVAGLLFAGHISDWYGRKPVLLAGLGVAVIASVVFIEWQSLGSLIAARLLTGAALGASAATATAYLADLGMRPDGSGAARAAIVATAANIGGLGVGPLVAGLLARYAGHALTLPYVVLLAALGIAIAAVVVSPEGHPALDPRPRYRPQAPSVPARDRQQFTAAIVGALVTFAIGGLIAGLTGTLLAGPLHHGSPVLIGVAVFLFFGSAAASQTLTADWSVNRLVAAGIPTMLVGLAVILVSVWTAPPSLVLFLLGTLVAGIGQGAAVRGSLTVVIADSSPDNRARLVTTFFIAGYAGLSVPVLGVGVALQHIEPRVALLVFGAAVAAAAIATLPALLRRPRQSR